MRNFTAWLQKASRSDIQKRIRDLEAEEEALRTKMEEIRLKRIKAIQHQYYRHVTLKELSGPFIGFKFDKAVFGDLDNEL